TRLSGFAPSGTCAAIFGRWVLLLATMPLISAARVARCRAHRPWGVPGYPCLKGNDHRGATRGTLRSWRSVRLLRALPQAVQCGNGLLHDQGEVWGRRAEQEPCWAAQ